MAIASGVIVLWTGTAASIPANWSRETSLDAKYPKGTAAGVDPGTTGGALTHTHAFTHTHTAAHTHTIPTSSGGTGSTARDTGSIRPPVAHTHTSGDAQNPATALASDNPTSGTQSSEPAYFETIFIKSDGTPTGIPVNAVALWNTTTGPTGWNLCDAGGGRPDMRAVFLKGAAAAGNGGGTGGAATHSGHTIPSHTHGTDFSHAHPNVTSAATAASMVGGNVSGAAAATATQTHTHVITVVNQATDAITGNTDTASGSGGNEPPYVLQGFIQNNNAGADIPDKIIALWVGTLATIPTDWALMDGAGTTTDLRGQYVKGATTLAGVGGTGGSTTHTHTVTNHTHAVAAHTHTLTHADGAGSNETAGAVNCSTTTHTHTWGPTGSSSFTSGSGSPTSVDNNTTTEPPFSTVAFIQYTAPAAGETPTVRAPLYARILPAISILAATFATNLLLTTLAPVAAPFSQDVWPVPTPVAVRRFEQAPPNLLLTTLASIDRPFVKTDWPIQPPPARLRTDPVDNILVTLPPGSLPPGQKAWPELQPLRQLTTSIPANLFGTLLAPTTAPFAQDDWPIPLKVVSLRPSEATRNLLLTLPPGSLPPSSGLKTEVQAASRPLSINLGPNLLSTLFAPTGEAPFRQNDWPRIPPPTNRIAPKHSAYRLSFGPPDIGAPFNRSDWPIQPKLNLLRPADSTANVLLRLPPPNIGPLPFNQYLWPKLEKLPDIWGELAYLNLSLGTLPFRQTNWPIQPLLPRLRPADAWSNVTAFLPAPAVPLPFNASNWPIQPKLPTLRPADAIPDLLLRLPPGSLPFGLSNWPIQPPLRLLRPAEAWSNVTAFLPAPAVPLPFNESDWPIQPKLAQLRPADATRNVLLNLPPGALAFNQSNWPNIQRPDQDISAFETRNLLVTTLAPTEQPFNQDIWPIQPKLPTLRPAEPIPDILLRLPPGKLAFSQTNWPIQPRMAVHRLPDAPRNITINLPPPQVAAGGIKHKRKWRRT